MHCVCVSCDPLSLRCRSGKIVTRREINVPCFCYFVAAAVHIESSQPHLVSTGGFRLSSKYPTPSPTPLPPTPLLPAPRLASRPFRLPPPFPRTPSRRLTPPIHPHPARSPPPPSTGPASPSLSRPTSPPHLVSPTLAPGNPRSIPPPMFGT